MTDDSNTTPRRARRRRSPQPTRRWCIPPGILREPGEHLEASQILEEFQFQGTLAYLLWSALRDVTLWASVAPDRRAGLFGQAATGKRLDAIRAAAAGPELEMPLTALAAVVDAPATASPDPISLACVELSRWALGQGAFGTALAYAQAASLAAPDSAAPAGFAGRVALRWGRLARAETWSRRAIGLGRRTRAWDTYTQAYVDLGTIYMLRGSGAAARRYYTTAVRSARRNGLREIGAAAFHGLLRIALDAGQWEDAERFFGAAVRAYGRGNPRLPDVLHDGAYLWVSTGRYRRAVPLLQQLLPGRTQPVDRALTFALLARAAAGDGQVEIYQYAWSSAWSIVTGAVVPTEHRRELLELGRASAQRRDWTHVNRVASLHATLPAAAQATDRRIAEQLAELASESRRPFEDPRDEDARPEEAPPPKAPHRANGASGRRKGRGWPEYSHVG